MSLIVSRFLDRLRWACLGCVCAALALAGCSAGQEPTYPVSGTVTLEGQPVSGGTIFFRPASGPLATGAIDSQGHFELTTYAQGDGAVAGKHAIALGPPDKTFTVSAEELELPDDPEALRQTVPFPARYLSFESSELSADIERQPNRMAFELRP